MSQFLIKFIEAIQQNESSIFSVNLYYFEKSKKILRLFVGLLEIFSAVQIAYCGISSEVNSIKDLLL